MHCTHSTPKRTLFRALLQFCRPPEDSACSTGPFSDPPLAPFMPCTHAAGPMSSMLPFPRKFGLQEARRANLLLPKSVRVRLLRLHTAPSAQMCLQHLDLVTWTRCCVLAETACLQQAVIRGATSQVAKLQLYRITIEPDASRRATATERVTTGDVPRASGVMRSVDFVSVHCTLSQRQLLFARDDKTAGSADTRCVLFDGVPERSVRGVCPRFPLKPAGVRSVAGSRACGTTFAQLNFRPDPSTDPLFSLTPQAQ